MKIWRAFINDPKYVKLYPQFQVSQTGYHPRQHFVGACLLSKAFHIPLKTVLSGKPFIKGKYGKPVLRDHTVDFNITHSKYRVLLAVDRTPIGIDVEYRREIDPYRIRRAFTTNERQIIIQTRKRERSQETLRLWTVKESVLKLLGLGLTGQMQSVTANPDLKQAHRKGRTFLLMPFMVHRLYIGTIAKNK